MTKLGPHVLYATAAALAWAQGAPLVKQLDLGEGDPNLGALRLARADAVKIFRLVWNESQQTELIRGGGAGAARAVDQILVRLGTYRDPLLYVELANETHQRLGDGLEEHARFVAGATARLHAEGIRVAAFSFSAGGYEWADMSYLASLDYCGLDVERDAVSIHEYWEGIPFDQVFALRYRSMIRANAQANGKVHPPLLITECGRGKFTPAADPSWGWRSAGLSEGEYLDELEKYDQEIGNDAYVLGATVFTAGASFDGSPMEWSFFDTDGVNLAALLAPTSLGSDSA